MKNLIFSCLFILLSISAHTQDGCVDLSMSVTVGSLNTVQIFTATQFLTPTPWENVHNWVVTDMSGSVIHEENTGIEPRTTFDHTVPNTETMMVTLNLTNPISGIDCEVIGTLMWVEQEVLPGVFVGRWEFDGELDASGFWPPLTAEILEIRDISCFGADDGFIATQASGGFPNWQYSLDGGPFLIDEPNFEGLEPGMHEIVVRDRGPIEVTLPFEITEPEEIFLDIETFDVSCNGSSNGQIIVTATGGTIQDGYKYYLDGDGPFASGIFSGLEEGDYDIEVEDDNGCRVEDSAEVEEPEDMVVASSLGSIIANTNPALPESYNFQEYVFAEPNDQGTCNGIENETAEIEEVFLSQTHRHAIGHPLLFTIGERPVLLQLAVTGTGAAPDVQVEGVLNGSSLGTLCLAGPNALQPSIDTHQPNICDYFSVTLPKAWIKQGLELRLTAGDDSERLRQKDLKIRPYTELNLVNVNMDLMDYNHLPHRTPAFDNFLEELASAVPVSVVRFGHFPQTIKMPIVAANSWEGIPDVVAFDSEVPDTDLDRGILNSTAHDLLGSIQQATGDYPNTIYFGNTLNLDPGGWGLDGNFVSFEYTDVFIHELGHAFSLPHWEDEYNLVDPQPDQHNYPYSGETGFGGGRGEAWNFIQDSYEFVSPYCEDSNGEIGIERSDCMQREHPCVETRPSGPGPWDGYGDFTVMAISDFILGSEVKTGQVEYRGGLVDYQMKENPGYPRVSLDNGQRVFTRLASQPQNTYTEDLIKLPGSEAVEQEVYLITGCTHVSEQAFNIIYDPIQYTGTLLPTIDPTDASMFATLQSLDFDDAPELYDQERDVTLKLTYADGTISHVLVPFDSSDRLNPEDPSELVSLAYFSVVVPGDQPLCNVELYRREFIISDAGNDWRGNINDPSQNINAANFMDDAVLMATLDHSCNCPGTPGYITPGTSCDDGNPYTINDVEDGFCNCAGTGIPTCGLITNSEFTQTLTGWRWWGCDASSDNDEAAITIQNEFDAGFGFDLLSANEGESYTLSFEAYATDNRPLTLIHRAEYDFENDQEGTEFLNTTFNITTTKTEYEVTYTVTENGDNSLLEFNLSGNEAGLFIDNVCLYSGCGSSEIPYNGLDDDCDPLTLDDDLDQDSFALANDCDDNSANINPAAVDIPDNGIDEDCNGSDATSIVDNDGDGFDNTIDCDDNNASINPGQTETPYNGVDDDCNPATLDDDLDQDGFANANDCDDNNASVNPGQMETPYNGVDDDCNLATLDDDLDQDGFVQADDCNDNNAGINPNAVDIPDNGIDENCDGMDATAIVDNDGDGFFSDVDCNDNDANINPGVTENCDGIDNNCNGQTDEGLTVLRYYEDADGDGYGVASVSLVDCQQPVGYATAFGDCDDNNSSINPGQTEAPYNGVDDDCNTGTPDDDLDQDGFLRADDCDDNNAAVNPNQTEVPYNGIDEDCNPATLDDDLDQDGFVREDDCDDNDGAINPNATDIPDNGIDEDCDGVDETDIIDADGDGFDNTVDCDDTNSDINPGQTEMPYNGIDDDCDAATFDDDLDQDGFVLADDCDDDNADINPDQMEEPYNGVDEDCDAATLDDDLDQDGFVLGEDCDDENAAVNPDQTEVPYNGIDEDCDSATLDDDLDQDGFVFADDCDDENSEINPDAEEIPNNGIDEDCDGMDLISATHEIAGMKINIFPNPASDLINIDVQGKLNFYVNLYSLEGKLVLANSNSKLLEVASTPAGTYLLELVDMDSGQKVVEKIVIGK